MRAVITCTVILFAGLVLSAQPANSVQAKFKSKNYTISWNKRVPSYSKRSELEVGYGNGHGGTLGWIYFLPRNDHVDVLSIELDEGWSPYTSKWPPDRAPVAVRAWVM